MTNFFNLDIVISGDISDGTSIVPGVRAAVIARCQEPEVLQQVGGEQEHLVSGQQLSHAGSPSHAECNHPFILDESRRKTFKRRYATAAAATVSNKFPSISESSSSPTAELIDKCHTILECRSHNSSAHDLPWAYMTFYTFR